MNQTAEQLTTSQAVEELTAEPIYARNFPLTPISVQDVRDADYHLEDLWLPTVAAKETALSHNLERFTAWCREQNVDHAPHGKTSMSPQVWHRHLEHGAWGITAATVAQARTMHRFGIERVLIANEVVDPGQLRWLARTALDGDRWYACLIDSEEGLRRLEAAAADAGSAVPVLVEIGVPGRRTGVRSIDDALGLARAVHDSKHLRLDGIEGYEGVHPQGRTDDQVEAVSSWLQRLPELTRRADEEGLFDAVEEIIVTAGGSAFPDLAAAALGDVRDLSKPVRRIIRSGCVITHDHLAYERSSPLRSKASDDPLLPALTCYADVNSVPEPGRALVAVGKRDVPVDIDLPIVLRARRPGEDWREVNGLTVVELNDHHLFLDDPESTLRVGDQVELGLSHPCTTFDKWRLLPVIDDDGLVVDALATLF